MVRRENGIAVGAIRKARFMEELGFSKEIIADHCDLSVSQVQAVLSNQVPRPQLLTAARRATETHHYKKEQALRAMEKARTERQRQCVMAVWCDVIPEWREEWEQSNGSS